MKLAIYIMVPEPITMAYFINPSNQPVCQYVYLPLIARQQLGKNVTVATNTHTTIQELLDASFFISSMRESLANPSKTAVLTYFVT